MDTDKIRAYTSANLNTRIDAQTESDLAHYAQQHKILIKQRIKALEKEWDIKRSFLLTAAITVSAGLALSLTGNKKWLLLSAASALLLAQQALQGWCPPIALFRHFGMRTEKEINKEKEALVRLLNQ